MPPLAYINRLLELDNTEGILDDLYWTRIPGLFVQARGYRKSYIVRWIERGRGKRVMGLGSKEGRGVPVRRHCRF